MVWEQRDGWWFGPGDCKSLWPALVSSGWQRCLSSRHSSNLPSVPPYWSHSGSLFHTDTHTPPALLFHSLLQLQASYFHFLSFQEKDKEKECGCTFHFFPFLLIFSFSLNFKVMSFFQSTFIQFHAPFSSFSIILLSMSFPFYSY